MKKAILLLLTIGVVTTTVAQQSNVPSGENTHITVRGTDDGIKTYIFTDRATGKVVAIRRQGIYKGCGVPVGTDSIFNSEGRLSSTITYQHINNEAASGCLGIYTHRRTVTFFANGKPNTTAEHTYCYECEPRPCGVWEVFDVNGNLLQKTIHSTCNEPIRNGTIIKPRSIKTAEKTNTPATPPQSGLPQEIPGLQSYLPPHKITDSPYTECL